MRFLGLENYFAESLENFARRAKYLSEVLSGCGVDKKNVTGPNTLGVVSTHLGYSSVFSSMRGVLFGTLDTFYFQQNTSPYISHDTDTMMTHYDTGGTEIPQHHSMFVFW
jgi:hypothetical protein